MAVMLSTMPWYTMLYSVFRCSWVFDSLVLSFPPLVFSFLFPAPKKIQSEIDKDSKQGSKKASTARKFFLTDPFALACNKNPRCERELHTLPSSPSQSKAVATTRTRTRTTMLKLTPCENCHSFSLPRADIVKSRQQHVP